MTRRQILGWLAVGSGALAMTQCTALFPNKFRFKMVVEVETPQGLKTGSSVMELAAGEAPIKLVGTGAGVDFKGEAVPVDLPGGTLFALVGGETFGYSFVAKVIDTFDPSHPREKSLILLVGQLGRKSSIGRSVQFNPQDYPTLMRFRDIRDPKSVELVDPQDLAKSFGAGVRLKRIMLTVVDEPVTVGIEGRLRKIGIFPDRSLDNNFEMTTEPTAAQRLGYRDFSRGIKK